MSYYNTYQFTGQCYYRIQYCRFRRMA